MSTQGGPRRAARPYRRPQPDASRRAAFDVLRAVAERDAYANLVLPELLTSRGIEGRDAAFATELTYGTLRGQGTYDVVLAACVDRPLDQVDAPVRDVLRLGAHQLLAMRVPSHAAVSATVELARAVLGDGRAKFVNAVLRRVGASELASWVDELAPAYDVDPVGHLAVAHSHPRWVVSAVRDALGGSLAETAALLAADNVAPAVSLVARPGRADVAELIAAGAVPGRWSPYAATLPGGEPGAVPAVREGRAGVQDEGSQLVALALAATPIEGSDQRWLDLCAGPGGKAALLGALAGERGGRLVAAELAPHRARLTRRAVGDDAAVVVADGRVPAWQAGAFDRVLVDAPCTGLGALRRRPEARWRRTAEDVAPLSALQRTLLATALAAVRPGGVVAYVTCSPHLAETRAVVGDALRGPARVEQLDARASLPAMPDLGEGPDVQLWPHRHGTDAMYLALLRRSE
jgi:16S rRNA (cytosine967-C5)-methyltransferase